LLLTPIDAREMKERMKREEMFGDKVCEDKNVLERQTWETETQLEMPEDEKDIIEPAIKRLTMEDIQSFKSTNTDIGLT
jgi:hypothetical protein